MTPPSPADVEAHLASLAADLESKYRLLAESRRDLKRSHEHWHHRSKQSAAQSAEDAEKALRRDRKGIEANASELRSTALAVVADALTREAPGYLAEDWSGTIWKLLPPAALGNWVRLGTIGLGPDTLPIALPLSAGAWSIVTSDADAFRSIAQNVIARVVASFQPQRVRVIAFDPSLTIDLAAFAGLRAVSQHTVPPAITSDEEFEASLEALRRDITAVDDRLTAGGHNTYWEALAASDPLAVSIPLRLLIIGADPQLLTDRGRARLDQIRRLAADRGLLLIESLSTAPADRASSITVTLDGQSATASSLPGLTWTPDPWAGDKFIRALSATLADRPRESLAPTVEFQRIVEAIDDPWMSDSDEGLEATIGIRDAGDLVVRLRSENPPMPNALIGGAVGQGKSNLLHVLINSLAAKYSPAELQMVLVDLKDGVEFARYGPSPSSPTWLPHVRALGLEFDPDYCVAVLRWTNQQQADRAQAFKAAGDATSLKNFHLKTGKAMPRLLLVIDEFQRLFEGDDDQAAEAAALLESIARTGRGYGIHLVLASQAITGIRGLAVKGEAIFGQFHNRVTLRNTRAESQAFLSAGNTAAADLEHRGDVIVNDALGVSEANTLGTVAFAAEDYLTRLQTQLFQQGHGEPPHVFRASAFAAWAGTPASPSGPAAVVGQSVAVEARPHTVSLQRAPNQAVIVAGSSRDVAIAILVRAVTTAARTLSPNARVTLLDGESHAGTPSVWISALAAALASQGAAVETVSRNDIPTTLNTLASSPGSIDLLVPIALDSVDLDVAAEPDFIAASESLKKLLETGPLQGMWTIGWWLSMSVLEKQLGYRAPGVRAWSFCGVPLDDLKDICGHTVREPAAEPRFLFFDRTSGGGALPLVPFAPADILGEAGHE